MPEKFDGKNVFTLLEVNKSIEKTLSERYKSSYWVKAEMNKLNFYVQSGHCYPELVEKREGKVIAQIKATFWKENYLRVNANFLRVLKEPLKDGIKILFLARITYDSLHGLSLIITDIDPSYTLGDIEKEKQETITKLESLGIFNQNKALKIPLLPQRIAIISVQASKGYADFVKVIDGNAWGYRFFHLLFPSLLQGDNAVQSIIGQLRRIKKVVPHFDVVAIIRGGGGDVGLSCYNNFDLAKEIAAFPLPVITGIGHATNETVAEMISFQNAITPTKIAEYLIQQFHNFSVPVEKAREKVKDKSLRLLSDERTRFLSEIKLFRSVTKNMVSASKNSVKEKAQALFQHSRFLIAAENGALRSKTNDIQKGVKSFVRTQIQTINQSRVDLVNISIQMLKNKNVELLGVEKNVNNMSPFNVLKRGYSITLLGGKGIKNIDDVKSSDVIETLIFDGSIISAVNFTKKT